MPLLGPAVWSVKCSWEQTLQAAWVCFVIFSEWFCLYESNHANWKNTQSLCSCACFFSYLILQWFSSSVGWKLNNKKDFSRSNLMRESLKLCDVSFLKQTVLAGIDFRKFRGLGKCGQITETSCCHVIPDSLLRFPGTPLPLTPQLFNSKACCCYLLWTFSPKLVQAFKNV